MKYIYQIFFLLLLSLSSCISPIKEDTFVLDIDHDKNLNFPYKPEKISVSYTKDSIFIQKEFKSNKTIKYKLYLKDNQFYFYNKKKHTSNYYSKSYLFLKKYGPDSCYSLPLLSNNNSYISSFKVRNIDFCFSKIRGGNFSTIIRFTTSDTISFNENFFYTSNYRIYKIALRYNNKLYWYKVKK